MNNKPITDEEIQSLLNELDCDVEGSYVAGADYTSAQERTARKLIAHYQATKDIVKKVRAYQDNPITRHQFAMFDALPPLPTNNGSKKIPIWEIKNKGIGVNKSGRDTFS